MPSTIRIACLSLFAALAALAASSVPIPAAQVEHAPPALTAGQRNAPMAIKVMRDGRPGCGSDCSEWIAMEGRIVPGSAADFDRTLRALHGRHLPVFIDSGGGAVRDAMAIGRAIRSRHLDVAVMETVGCSGCGRGTALPQDKGAVCASACVLVLAAGESRIVAPTVAVGVHQMSLKQTQVLVKRTYRIFYGYLGGQRREIARILLDARPIATRTRTGPPSASTNREVAHYLETMGVGSQLMPMMLATPPDSIRWLKADELRASALMTTQRDGTTLLAKTDPQQRAPEAARPASDDARLDIVAGTRIETEKGTVAWRLERAEGRHVAITADILVPSRQLKVSVRIVPTSTAAAAPLTVEIAATSTGGRSVDDRVQRIFPLEARSATRAEAVITADAKRVGATTWRLKPRPDATIVGPGAPERLGLRLVIDGDHGDLRFACGTATVPLYREAARDWATEVARKPATPAPATEPLIKVSAPWR